MTGPDAAHEALITMVQERDHTINKLRLQIMGLQEEVKINATVYADDLAKSATGNELKGAVDTYLDACDAYERFVSENPNDTTRRWDAAFNARNLAYETLRRIAKT